jgi:N-acyl-L-homoserine lactone synthetase
MPNKIINDSNITAIHDMVLDYSKVISELDTSIMRLLKRVRWQQERLKSLEEHGIR